MSRNSRDGLIAEDRGALAEIFALGMRISNHTPVSRAGIQKKLIIQVAASTEIQAWPRLFPKCPHVNDDFVDAYSSHSDAACCKGENMGFGVT